MSSIHAAAQAGNVAYLEELLAHDPDAVHLRTGSWGTPLLLAAAAGQRDAADALLDAGADLEARCLRRHITPLGYAVLHGHEQLVGWLLARGADPNAVIDDDSSILKLAAYCGNMSEHLGITPGSPQHLRILRLLLNGGADPNWLGATQESGPLQTAARWGHGDAVALLLRAGAEAEGSSKIPCRYNDDELGQWLAFQASLWLAGEARSAVPPYPRQSKPHGMTKLEAAWERATERIKALQNWHPRIEWLGGDGLTFGRRLRGNYVGCYRVRMTSGVPDHELTLTVSWNEQWWTEDNPEWRVVARVRRKPVVGEPDESCEHRTWRLTSIFTTRTATDVAGCVKAIEQAAESLVMWERGS